MGDLLERDGLAAFNAQPADALDGVVVVHLGPPPAEGRTVVSWGHPTTGSASECAPSLGLDPYIGIEGMRVLLDRGYTVVATDYTGMGTAGPDSYLIVILWGHSQGGQAVLFAAERAAEYAPELDIRAVAAAAPAADLKALLQTHLDDVSGVTIGSYALTAYSEIYADRGADLADILTPGALAAQPQMNELCLLTHIDQLHDIADPLVGSASLVVGGERGQQLDGGIHGRSEDLVRLALQLQPPVADGIRGRPTEIDLARRVTVIALRTADAGRRDGEIGAQQASHAHGELTRDLR